MSAVRAWGNSDILPATGEERMQESAAEKFWTWRRTLLAIGYVVVFITGVQLLLAADPTGLILMLAAVLGFVFLHRTWTGLVVWAYVFASGVVAVMSGDDLGFYGLAAGVGLGLLAVPWRHREPVLPRGPVYWTRQAQPAEVGKQTNGAPAPNPHLPPDIQRRVDAHTVERTSPVVEQGPSAASTTPETPTNGDAHAEAQKVFPGALFIESIGKISLTLPWKDLTPDLMRRPVLAFQLLYLYAREVRRAGDRLTRSSMIDEVAHGVKDPRGRLRGYLRDLSHLPAPLGAMIKVEDELIGFDLLGQDTDVDELRSSVEHMKQGGPTVSDSDILHAQELLRDMGDGVFLPGFEDLEKRVTKGRGIAGQVLAEVRAQVLKLRADLAVATANALLDRGQAAEAAAVLDPIVAGSEDRDDVVRTLIAALRESGQHIRAAEIRRRYTVGQET
jgi:hypothetical protein